MAETVKTIGWKRNLFVVWLSQIFAMAGFAAITPFIPFFFKDRYGMTDEKTLGMWISALTFFGFLSFCLSAPLWGILADRFGRKLMLLRSYYVTAFLFPLLYIAPNPVAFIAIRFCVSAFSGTVTAAQTLIVTGTPEEKQGFALGTLSTALWSGNMFGFMFGSMIVTHFGYLAGFLLCGAMFLVGGIMVQFLVTENFTPAGKQRKTGEKRGISGFFAAYSIPVWIVLFLFLMMGMARRIDEPYLAILVSTVADGDSKLSILYTGRVCLAAALGGLLSGILVGKLCDRFSPYHVAVPSIVIASATMIFQAYAFTPLMLGSARFFHFLAAGGLEPAFQTVLSRLSPQEKRGTLFGFASSLRMFGILAASLLGGGVIYVFESVKFVFITAGILFLLLIPVLFSASHFSKKEQKSAAANEK